MYMKLDNYIVDWNKEKNDWLKKNRKISFETIEIKLLEKDIIDIIPNESKKYKHQFLLVVEIEEYIYIVPFVIDGKVKGIFLKTIIPSRKYTKKYLK